MKNMLETGAPFTDTLKLLEFLGLSERGQAACDAGKPLLVPRSFVGRMVKGDPEDPLLLQVLPRNAEKAACPGFTTDPVGDGDACLTKGLLQKYKGRALLAVTEACALNCRFCFRRNRPHDAYADAPNDLDAALSHIENRTDLREVILSGGDPLVMPVEKLDRVLHRLGAMPHVARIRIHTRLPIADPGRIEGDVVRVLATSKKPMITVLHTNHPRELNDETAAALGALAPLMRGLLSQSVLLKHINDRVDTLIELSEKLIVQRVLPYYLHQLDKAEGTAHFEVSPEDGHRIIDEMRTRCPGYLVPRYVREIAGRPCKTALR